jgi:UDP-glucose 4-epimerase
MIKKVVIFGGSGFLGSYLADELLKNNFNIIIADTQKPKTSHPKQQFVKVNILNLESIKSTIKGAEAVYNLASLANLDDAVKDPLQCININVMGNLNLLEACRLNGKIKRFIYASSAYALSNKGSFYGISKQLSEKLTIEYKNKFNLKYTIIRYGSVYGERAYQNNYIYQLLYHAIKYGELCFKGDGEDTREFIHASDVAKLSVKVLKDKEFENVNVILTGMEKIKRIELLNMINEIMQNKFKIKKIKKKLTGQYKTTPYSYESELAKKIFNNSYIDLGQGIVQCIKKINQDIINKKNNAL